MDLTRGFSAEQLLSLDSHFHVNLMVEVAWVDEPLRFHLGKGNIEWQGKFWSGVGPLASVSLPVEAPGISSTTGQIRIVGFPIELEDMIDNRVRGVEVEILLALMNPDSREVLQSEPITLFKAAISSTRLISQKLGSSESGGAASPDIPGLGDVYHVLEVDLTTGPSARSKSSIYHTDEDQRMHFPSDTAGRMVILSRAKAEKFKWPQ